MCSELQEFKGDLASQSAAFHQASRDTEKYRRQAEDLAALNSQLEKKLESASLQIRELQSARNQAVSLLDSSRAEADTVRQQLEKMTADYSRRLSNAEDAAEGVRDELARVKASNSKLEREIDFWRGQKGEWEREKREWMEREGMLKERMDGLKGEVEEWKVEAERQNGNVEELEVSWC